MDVFCEVIEQIAFMFADPAEPRDLAVQGRSFMQASMSFTGQMQGEVAIAVPTDACSEIAANVLGMEADDPFVTERSADALKELLNVTCGHILTGLAGEKPVFDLSIPQVSDLDEAQLSQWLSSPTTLTFAVDDHPVLLRLQMQGGGQDDSCTDCR